MGDGFNLGVQIFGGGHGRHRDPIREEAREIAGQLDRGHSQMAAERLRQDLMTMNFPEQRRLVEEVDRFDRKGVGADLCLGNVDRRGGIWDDIRIRPPQYDYGRGGRGGPVYGGPVYGGPVYDGRRPPIYNGGRHGTDIDIRIDLNIFKRR